MRTCNSEPTFQLSKMGGFCCGALTYKNIRLNILIQNLYLLLNMVANVDYPQRFMGSHSFSTWEFTNYLGWCGFYSSFGAIFFFKSNSTYLEIKSVISIRHQVVFIGALELETMGDSSFRSPILSIATEVHETLIITQLLEVFVVVGHNSIA